VPGCDRAKHSPLGGKRQSSATDAKPLLLKETGLLKEKHWTVTEAKKYFEHFVFYCILRM
jgi:hypothetical protein